MLNIKNRAHIRITTIENIRRQKQRQAGCTSKLKDNKWTYKTTFWFLSHQQEPSSQLPISSNYPTCLLRNMTLHRGRGKWFLFPLMLFPIKPTILSPKANLFFFHQNLICSHMLENRSCQIDQFFFSIGSRAFH